MNSRLVQRVEARANQAAMPVNSIVSASPPFAYPRTGKPILGGGTSSPPHPPYTLTRSDSPLMEKHLGKSRSVRVARSRSSLAKLDSVVARRAVTVERYLKAGSGVAFANRQMR